MPQAPKTRMTEDEVAAEIELRRANTPIVDVPEKSEAQLNHEVRSWYENNTLRFKLRRL